MNAEHERAKYHNLYHHKAYAFYGHSNHGHKAHDLVSDMMNEAQNKSLLDVGCGWNEFVQQFRERHPGKRALGADFACPGADLIACATRLPLEAKSIGVLTAFDMLEHLLPEQVPFVLAEFARVAENFVFSISHVPSHVKWKGETLHPTVQPVEWWLSQIMCAGGCGIRQIQGFITGKWGNAVRIPY